MAASLKYTAHQYGSENELQRVGVWELDPTSESKYWVIYIHGGAWRDPRIDHLSFVQSINSILSSSSSPSIKEIAGFASLDYRLSPHPEFPQDPDSVPASQLRNARHPDHADDVVAGLRFLQGRYGFGSRYVLVGHSAGACLALQVVSGLYGDGSGEREEEAEQEVEEGTEGGQQQQQQQQPPPLILPDVIIPFEGIYDFAGLNARMGGTYEGFLAGAFGPLSREAWDAASPMTCSRTSVNYAERWPAGKLALLAWSPEDALVDRQEVEGMAARLRGDGLPERNGTEVVVWKDLEGGHDEIWEKGQGVARMVVWALGEVVRRRR